MQEYSLAALNVNALNDLDSLSAIPPVVNFLTTGDITQLSNLASLSAIPAVVDFLGLSSSAASASTMLTASTASTGSAPATTGTDPLTALNNVFSALGPPLTGQTSTTTASSNPLSSLNTMFSTLGARLTGQTSTTGSNPLSSLVSALRGSTAGTMAPAETGPAGVNSLSLTNGNTPGTGSWATRVTSGTPPNNDLTGSGPGALPNLVKSVIGGGSEGGTSQQDNTPFRSFEQDVNGSTGDQQTTGKSDNGSRSRTTGTTSATGNDNGSWSMKFTPKPMDSPILTSSGGPGAKDGIRGWGNVVNGIKSALGGRGEGSGGGAG